MDAPDIRWKTLSSANHGDHGAEEHSDEPYGEDDFMQAVREGRTPSGAELSKDMPRWRITHEDLRDLIAFLKTFD
jgi:hypothetical protein